MQLVCLVCSLHAHRTHSLSIGIAVQPLIVDSMDLIGQYTHPQSPGALVKAALCCAELIDESSSVPLQQQVLYSLFHAIHAWLMLLLYVDSVTRQARLWI